MRQPFILKASIRLDRLFHEHRKNVALVTSGASRTFEEVEETLYAVMDNLRNAGVRKGHLVALHQPNSELHLYLFLASWMMNFLYVPLDYKAPFSGLAADAGIDILVTDEDAQADPKCTVIRSDQILNDLCPANQKQEWPAVPFHREASAIFTSGSTGRPRGIVHSVGNYIFSALGTNEFIGLNASDRWLLNLPLFHVGGALIWVRTLLAGSACILPDPQQNIAEAIHQFRPTVISMVPAQLIRLLEQKKSVACLQRMKTILLGGAPLPSWLIDRSLDLGLPIMPTYGCTESCAQVTGVAKGSAKQAYHSAGQVVPHRDVRIEKDDRVALGGKTLFTRYLREREIRPFDQDGFFITADSGSFDAEGNLMIHGRTDGIFISGGENISPLEIENSLLRQTGIITAIVVPAPHREFGLTPWAFVETSTPFDETNILNKLREILPGYKLPKRIIMLKPENQQGKMKYSREALTRLAASLAEKDAGT